MIDRWRDSSSSSWRTRTAIWATTGRRLLAAGVRSRTPSAPLTRRRAVRPITCCARSRCGCLALRRDSSTAAAPSSTCEPTGERWWLGQSLCWQGINLYFMGQLDEALECAAGGFAIGEQLGDHRLQSYAAWNRAWFSATRGDGQDAIDWGHRSIELSPDPLNNAFSLGWTGYAYLEHGDAERAIALLGQSIELLAGMRYSRLVGWFRGWLAEAYLIAGDPVRANEEAKLGLQTSLESGFTWAVGLAQRALGYIARAGGDIGEARALAERGAGARSRRSSRASTLRARTSRWRGSRSSMVMPAGAAAHRGVGSPSCSDRAGTGGPRSPARRPAGARRRAVAASRPPPSTQPFAWVMRGPCVGIAPGASAMPTVRFPMTGAPSTRRRRQHQSEDTMAITAPARTSHREGLPDRAVAGELPAPQRVRLPGQGRGRPRRAAHHLPRVRGAGQPARLGAGRQRASSPAIGWRSWRRTSRRCWRPTTACRRPARCWSRSTLG